MAINRDIVAEVINRGDAALYGPSPGPSPAIPSARTIRTASLGPNYVHNGKQAKNS
jgi:hypothetical protein